MTTPTHSRLERLSFSGRDEDFPAFSEQLGVRMHVLNLGDCIEDKLEVPEVKAEETAGEAETPENAEAEKKR